MSGVSTVFADVLKVSLPWRDTPLLGFILNYVFYELPIQFLIMYRKITAWSVHLFTAVGAILAFWSLMLIVQGDVRGSLIVLALAAVIDSVDGTLSRRAEVTKYAPNIDGALMDNIIDYLTWVFLPVFWAYTFLDVSFLIGSLVLITSLFGFSNTQAKTDDNFFRGFPSYWNFVVLYLYVLGAGAWVSSAVMLILAILVLVPIKFVYPSRTEKWQRTTLILAIPYAAMIAYMLFYLQETPLALTISSFYYPLYYLFISVLFTSSVAE